MASEIKPKSKRGGKREGAGRKPKQITNAAFEGGALNQPGRSYIYFPTLDPAQELIPQSREALIRKARWLCNNEGLAAGAVDSIARHSVGAGIIPQARSKDTAWNKMVEQMFEDTAGTTAWAFDAAGQVNFYEAQSLIIKQVVRDGDFFGQFVKAESGRAMCRFIGAEHVGDGRSTKDETNFFDGVKFSEMMRPVAYRVLNDVGGERYQDIPAEQILHFKKNQRHGWLRGVTWLHHAVLHLQDMAETLAYTKQSFKQAAQVGLIITSETPGGVGLGRGITKSTTTGAGTVDGKLATLSDSLYSVSGQVGLKTGDKIETIKNDHPGQSFAPFMQHIRDTIAVGLGLSSSILWGDSGGTGPEVRKDLQQAAVLFSEIQQMIINQFCRKFWTYWLWHEIEAGRIPYVEDWYRVEWQTPQRITIDVGREGKLYIDLIGAGMMSPKRYFGMLGLDEEQEEDDMIAAAVRRKQKCEAAGLEVEEVFNSANYAKQSEQPIDTPAQS